MPVLPVGAALAYLDESVPAEEREHLAWFEDRDRSHF